MQTFGEVGVIGIRCLLFEAGGGYFRGGLLIIFAFVRFSLPFPPFRLALCIARASVNNGQSTIRISPCEKDGRRELTHYACSNLKSTISGEQDHQNSIFPVKGDN